MPNHASIQRRVAVSAGIPPPMDVFPVKLLGLASLRYCSRLHCCTVATDSTLALSNEGHSSYPDSANIGKWQLQHCLGLLQTDIYQFRTCYSASSDCCSDRRKTDAIRLLNHHHKQRTQQYIEFFCLVILSMLVNSFCTHDKYLIFGRTLNTKSNYIFLPL